MASSITIESLPSELLLHILTPFPTSSLLPLALTSRRFHALTTRLLHARSIAATTLPGHQLVLECYTPANRYSESSLHCTHRHTPGLDSNPESVAQLANMYSHFTLAWKQDQIRIRGGRWASVATPPPREEEVVAQEIELDEAEMFAQLCTVTTLLKDGPRPGTYAGAEAVGNGVIRVWRDWLSERAARQGGQESEEEGGEDGSQGNDVLWADLERTVGVRFGVEQMDLAAPVILEAGMERPVRYRLVFEEVLVRTRQLVMALEKSQAQTPPNSGTEIMIL